MTDQTTEQEIKEIWQLFRETDARLDRRIAETDARLEQMIAESAQTNAEVAQTTANLSKLEGLFTSQWGRLIEALVEPGVLSLFQERGHKVQGTHRRSKKRLNGSMMEIDITLVNQDEVIAVEVKSTLSVQDVDDFLDDLAEFTRFFPEYTNYRVYGAVAGLDISTDVARYAYRRGLYVLSVTGTDLVQILNDADFRPRDFRPTI